MSLILLGVPSFVLYMCFRFTFKKEAPEKRERPDAATIALRHGAAKSATTSTIDQKATPSLAPHSRGSACCVIKEPAGALVSLIRLK